jgi:CheY-like chemotaxis protein
MSSDRAQPTSSPERPSVLLIDDDADARDLLRRTLERAGFAAVAARHGAEGMARFGSDEFGLVITDIMMPVMDGFEVIRAVRAASGEVPIMAVSGAHDWDRFLRMALLLGADAALRKPVPREELLQTVAGLVGRPAADRR